MAGLELEEPEPGAEDVAAGPTDELDDAEPPAPPLETDDEGAVAKLDSLERVMVEVPLRVEVTNTVLVEVLPTLLLLTPPPVTASPVVLLVSETGGMPLSTGPLSEAELVETEVNVTKLESADSSCVMDERISRGQAVVVTATTEVVRGHDVTSGPQLSTVMYDVLRTVDIETAGNSWTTATFVTMRSLSSVALTAVNAPAAARASFLNCIVGSRLSSLRDDSE